MQELAGVPKKKEKKKKIQAQINIKAVPSQSSLASLSRYLTFLDVLIQNLLYFQRRRAPRWAPKFATTGLAPGSPNPARARPQL